MPRAILLFALIWILANAYCFGQANYFDYHSRVLSAERLIATESYQEALAVYDQLFSDFEFVFLREHKVAAQLAVYLNQTQRAFDYLGLGVANGWTLKEIKKNNILKKLKKEVQWAHLELNYEALREDFSNRMNAPVRTRVEQMFRKDQKLALKYYFKPGDEAREKLIQEEGIPHSEAQIGDLLEILNQTGYPGEQLIGNSLWMTTILCHHNSLSPEYQQSDDIYPNLKPRLMVEVSKGMMDPYDLALIDDWYIAVKSGRKEKSYGYINHISNQDELAKANQLRADLFIRSIELRNQLVDIQNKTKMDFYLAGETWVKGKIVVP
ncbi:MAG: hypothetical protein RIC35_18835 [Marinoscillum sp.]